MSDTLSRTEMLIVKAVCDGARTHADICKVLRNRSPVYLGNVLRKLVKDGWLAQEEPSITYRAVKAVQVVEVQR